MILRPGAPEVVEADLVERLGRLVARDVPTELRGLGVRLQHDRDRVPAHEGGGEPLELRVAGERLFLVDRDRVDVRSAEPGRDLDAVLLRMVDRVVEQEGHPLAAVGFDDGVDGVEPFLGLDGIAIGDVCGHGC